MGKGRFIVEIMRVIGRIVCLVHFALITAPDPGAMMTVRDMLTADIAILVVIVYDMRNITLDRKCLHWLNLQ